MLEQRSATDRVAAYFDAKAGYWGGVYAAPDVHAVVYRRRRERVLEWVRELPLAAGSRVLEVGAGAGGVAVELAARGVQVDVVDTSAAMLDHSVELAGNAGTPVRAIVADVQALPQPSGTYAAVVAIGVLPWLPSPQLALREIARVLEPGGFVVATYDNRLRLISLLDPWMSPLARGPRRLVRPVRTRLVRPRSLPRTRQEKPADVAAMLRAAGLVAVRDVTLGFGPFSFRRRAALPDELAVRVDRVLQGLADHGVAPLARMGAHGVVLARRPAG